MNEALERKGEMCMVFVVKGLWGIPATVCSRAGVFPLLRIPSLRKMGTQADFDPTCQDGDWIPIFLDWLTPDQMTKSI